MEIWTLVPFELELELGVWLVVSMFVIWLSTSANYLLVELLLYWGSSYEQVKELSLLVAGLVVEASF